jgi:AraC family transcriptional regulator, transcriptional activator FtrA
MPKLPVQSRAFNPLVVALAYDGLCAFEFSCTAEVFGLPRPEMGPGWYRFETCSLRGRQVTGQYGLTMDVDGDMNRLASAGTVVIPGWRGINVPVPFGIIEALRKAHSRGARLLSICSGSFVLAATGLLDGKRATTHWRYAEALQRCYPKIQVDPAVLYVDEGQILTSAGSAAGLDLCLHLIRRDFGSAFANRVARRLVIPPHRDGGQAQFLERPVDPRERGSLAALMDKLRGRLHKPMSIAELARLAAMSERTFIRRFRAASGMAPGEWITRARVDRARELLESSALSVDQIATRTGLGTPATLRHHFRRKVGVSPAEYRKRFSQSTRRATGKRSLLTGG